MRSNGIWLYLIAVLGLLIAGTVAAQQKEEKHAAPAPAEPAPAAAPAPKFGEAKYPSYTRAEGAKFPEAEAAKNLPLQYNVDLVIVNPTLKLAFNHLKDGHTAEAVKDVFGFKAPTDPYPQLNFVSALIARAQGKPFDAINDFRGAYVMSADMRLKELALFERARTYQVIGHYIEARADYMIFTKGFPNSRMITQAHLGLAQSLAGQKLYGEALSSFQQAGDSAEAKYGAATALSRMGRYSDADAIFKEAEAKYPQYLEQSLETRYLYGENLRQMGRLFDAKRILKEVKLPPFRDKATLALARIASEEGNDAEAVKKLEIMSGSRDRELALNARLELAAIKARSGQFGDARKLLEDIRVNYPYGREYDAAILGLARISEAEGDYKAAMSFLRELVLRSQPELKAVDEYENILRAVMALDDAEQFKSVWSVARKWMFDVQRQATLYDVAMRLKTAGDPYLDIIKWIEEYGSGETRLKSLGELVDHYTKIGDIARGRTYLERIKAARGTGPEFIRAEAALMFAAQDRRGAASRIMSIAHPNEDDLTLLAQLYKLTPKVGVTLAYFERGLKALPNASSKVALLFADMLYEQGQQKKSLKYYEAVHEKDSGNEWAIYRMAVMSKGARQEELFKLIGSGSSIVGKMAESRLRDISVSKSMEGK